MIRSIGNDPLTTAAPRPAGVARTTAPFPNIFGAIAAPDTSVAPSSFTTRHAPTDARGRVADDTATTARLDDAIAEFKKELSLTPAERVRRDVLKSMDLTDEAIEAMPPKERIAAEEKIAMEVARRMEIMNGGAGRQAGPASGTMKLS